MSVNFSSVQFIQDGLADEVLAIVERNKIPASSLRIEVTESAVIANPQVVQDFMKVMHKHGVWFYLDDFGTGYSSLSTMIALPFDVVKLDKSILWSATAKDSPEPFLMHLIACFKSIGSMILSEGVETRDQHSFLKECGCDLMQGYLFSRPLPAEEATAVIAESERALL